MSERLMVSQALILAPVTEIVAAQALAVHTATPEDADFLRGVYVATRWDEMAASGWPQAAVISFLHDQHRLQTLHHDRFYPAMVRLVVVRAGVAVGRFFLLDMETDIRIVDIALLPDVRGQGIGGALIGWTQHIAGMLGRQTVSLHVEAGNPARRLYTRMGFSPVEKRGTHELMRWPVGG